jgi:AcrR family transcriptional regulator
MNQPPTADLRRKSDTTKSNILDAAQQAFATTGYGQSVLRGIAEAADINPAMIMRYFGSKEGLFEQAMAATLSLDAVMSQPREVFGAAALAQLTDANTATIRSTSMLALSIGDTQARSIARRLMNSEIIAPLAAWLGPPHAESRAILFCMLTLGFTAFRILIPVGSTEAESDPFVADWIRSALQQIADITPSAELAPEPDRMAPR